MICRAIPYEGTEPYIFLSYCHKDKELLYPLFERMVLDGYRIWYDNGNHAGDDWLEVIEQQLEQCNACVAFISDNSSLSHNCKNEIVYAMMCNKKVIPILIESTALPKGLRMQLSHLHYLKSQDFPSDQALLNEIYQVPEVHACKALAGSLSLRTDIVETNQDKASDAEKPTFFSGLKKVDVDWREPENNVPSDTPESTDVPGEPGHQTNDPKVPGTEEDPTSLETKDPTGEGTVGNSPVNSSDTEDPGSNSNVSEDPGGTNTTRPPQTTILNQALSAKNTTVRLGTRSLLLQPFRNRGFVLDKPVIKLGRSSTEADIVIEGNESISKHHADILQHKFACFLKDVGSANGSYANRQRLQPGVEVQLESSDIFYLSDELLILISGYLAHLCISKGTVSFLLNEDRSAFCIMDSDTLRLNRNRKWPDGTLSDPRIHRNAHAMLREQEDRVYLIDESPDYGNGTFLNGRRMQNGQTVPLSSGDRIRLGDTTLEFLSIKL